MPERSPFHGSYLPNKDKYYALRAAYKNIYFSSVNTQYAEERVTKRSDNEERRHTRIDEIREMGRYMKDRFEMAMREYPGTPFQVVDTPGQQTLIVELALTEVSPTLTPLNIAGTVSGFLVPGSGVVRLLGSGSVSMEGIVRDGATNEILVEFKDREGDKNSAFSVKDFQQYAHVRASIDEWSQQFAELSATPADHQVKDSLPFTLRPF